METGSYLLNYFTNSAWAITKSKLEVLETVLSSKISGTLNNSKYKGGQKQRDNSEVAVVEVHGTLMNKAGYLDAMSGIVSMTHLESLITSLADNSNVDSIILDIDSPGGTVSGTQSLATAIKQASTKKEIVAVVTGSCCSGAYWIASACDAIYSSSESNLIGSVGVYMAHLNNSEKYKKEGIEITYVQAGAYKTIGSDNKGLDIESLNYLQKQVNSMYKIFVNAVKENRPVLGDPDDWADGKVFLAGEAMKLNLIDDYTTVQHLLTKEL